MHFPSDFWVFIFEKTPTKSVFIDVRRDDIKIELPCTINVQDYEIKFFDSKKKDLKIFIRNILNLTEDEIVSHWKFFKTIYFGPRTKRSFCLWDFEKINIS